ncbi:hypothetical protein ACFX1T_046242 [Malus domestica]
MLTDKSKFQRSSLKHPGSRRIKKALFALRSSSIVHPKIKPQRPFGSTIIHQFKIKPRRPLKRVFFVLRSSFFQDQAPTALGSNPPSRSNPKALEDPFITVLQDQAQKPLKIRSSLLFKIKPQRPLKKHSSSRSSPNGSLKIRSNPPSKIKPTALEETSNSSSKIKPRRPLDQTNIHKSTPYGDRIRGSK